MVKNMETFSTTQKEQAFAKASEIQKWLYRDPVNGEHLANIAQKHGISEEQYKSFAVYVGELILKLRTVESVPTAVQTLNLPISDLTGFRQDIESFLKRVPETKKEPQAMPNEDLEKEIAETTETLQQIQSMRTMQTDSQKQDAAPNTQTVPKTSIPNAPSTTQTTADTKPQPRWESDVK